MSVTQKAAGAGATGTGANAAAGQGKNVATALAKKKVDIEKTSNQQQPGQNRGGNNNSRGGNNGGNNNANGRNRDNAKGKDRNRRNAPQQAPASEEDVQKQVKETLARLINKDKGQKKGVKWRKEKREAFHSREREAAEAEAAESRVLKLTEFVTANDLAVMMDVPINEVIATCMNLGVMVSINQRLDAETINIVAEEFGFQTEYVSAEVVEAIHQEEDNEEDLVNRPPIVTVMGHVDHGKTSLLDYIRNANVIAGEAGGITQHIGAYNVKLEDGRRITFLDTPGHEAFTAMRARGAKVTDLCIIIVAADDNVMPQTVEAINHASAAGVPIVFAINKIDKPAANPDKIKEELAQMNYLVEEWGGKIPVTGRFRKKGLGVNELMEKVPLEAEMLDLKANPSRPATGSIIESSLDKGRGYVATVLVQNGTLRVGDIVLAGSNYGKVKAMFNERNQRVKEAGPATPVLILGLNGAPQAGDTFNVMPTEQEAREIANKREQLQRELGLRTNKRIGLEEIGRRRAIGNFHELNIIVKGDVDGSIEALSDSPHQTVDRGGQSQRAPQSRRRNIRKRRSTGCRIRRPNHRIPGTSEPGSTPCRRARRSGNTPLLGNLSGYRRGEGCHGRHARPRNQGRGYRHGRSASGIQDFQSRHYSRRYCTRRKNQTLLQSAPDSRRYRAIHRRTRLAQALQRRCQGGAQRLRLRPLNCRIQRHPGRRLH